MIEIGGEIQNERDSVSHRVTERDREAKTKREGWSTVYSSNYYNY